MTKTEFHCDFGSPSAYLVHKVIPSITDKTGIEFEYLPILLGGIFKATGNVPPAVSLQGIKNKPQYQAIGTRRFCTTHGIWPQALNPYFPVNTLKVKEIAQRAGFVFEAFSEIKANPRDSADHPHGVWSLQPSLRSGDEDKYRAVGESDRMTLRFRKPTDSKAGER